MNAIKYRELLLRRVFDALKAPFEDPDLAEETVVTLDIDVVTSIMEDIGEALDDKGTYSFWRC